MAATNAFGDLLLRVRQGDSDAASELVRRYESAIRIAVRTRLSDPALQRQLDSMDICQSVLASFFFRAAAGQYDLREPAQLVALLTRMAQNKLAMHARGSYRQRRDVRRLNDNADAIKLSADKSSTPDRLAINRDLLRHAFELMDPEVRRMADRRGQGFSWDEIAVEIGGEVDARRKQYRRAIDGIARTLDLD